MHIPGRVEMLTAIESLGARNCVYSQPGKWASFCDCKFGVAPTTLTHSEQNGCPELRSLHAFLSSLSNEQWAVLAERAGSFVWAVTPRAAFEAVDIT